jgi:hypothetical protein
LDWIYSRASSYQDYKKISDAYQWAGTSTQRNQNFIISRRTSTPDSDDWQLWRRGEFLHYYGFSWKIEYQWKRMWPLRIFKSQIVQNNRRCCQEYHSLDCFSYLLFAFQRHSSSRYKIGKYFGYWTSPRWFSWDDLWTLS